MATYSPGTDGGRDSEELPPDVVSDLLGEPRRRQMLTVLADREEEMTLGDLAAAVYAEEAGEEPASVGEPTRRSVREELFRDHLPKLTATDVVDYDSMLGTVELQRDSIVDRIEEGD